MGEPQSRNEAILQDTIDGVEYTDPPQSRIEALLVELNSLIIAGGSASHTYSTDEQIVGKWIDGATVYEKTIDCGYLYDTGTKEIPHNISNIKQIISHSGGATNENGTYLPLPKVSPLGLEYCVDLAATLTDIVITTGNDRTGMHAYVTILYIKTEENEQGD